jgi:hypothetical protein
MSKQLEILERCPLSEAARYVLDQEVPLPDDTSSPAPLVPWSHELIRALQLKKLGARANLFDATYDEDNRDWEKNVLRQEAEVEVDAAFWFSRDAIDLKHSMLLASNEDVERIYGLRPVRGSLVNEETGDERCLKTGFLFSQITVPTKELFELFPPRKEGGLLGGHKGTSEPIKRGGGRPRKHDWDRFYIEIIARVALKDLPNTQAKLIKEMTQWFADKNKEPSPSEIKKRISEIYHRVDEQRQKAGN